jgi:hypothetical protein
MEMAYGHAHRRVSGLARIGTRLALGGLAVVLAMAPALFGQMGASAQGDQPTVTIATPTDGQTVTDNTVAVVPQFQNWNQRCDLAGTRNVPGTGHYHLEIDGALVDMFCGPAVVSFQNLQPGTHTISVIPAKNDHSEIDAAKSQVKITYQPAHALPAVGGISAGKPSVSILWPRNGATVSGNSFPLVMDVRNYRLSCDLMGHPKVANTGHWHVDVDRSEVASMMEMKGKQMTQQQMMMAMMEAMATMLNMGCNNVFDVPLAGISKGKHTFYAVLVDNLHEPLEPAVTSSVTVTVK